MYVILCMIDFADVGGVVKRYNKRPGETGPLILNGGLSMSRDTTDNFRHKCTDVLGDIDEATVEHFQSNEVCTCGPRT